jgi:hypothetical protein
MQEAARVASLEREKGYYAGDPHAKGDKAEKDRRAALFAQWLVETYGADYLRQGEGVLDVAGGKGLLSLALWVRSGRGNEKVRWRPQSGRNWEYLVEEEIAEEYRAEPPAAGEELLD